MCEQGSRLACSRPLTLCGKALKRCSGPNKNLKAIGNPERPFLYPPTRQQWAERRSTGSWGGHAVLMVGYDRTRRWGHVVCNMADKPSRQIQRACMSTHLA